MSPAGHWAPDPTSWRSTPRPLGWKKIRAAILARDGYQCVWVNTQTQERCQREATDVDHIGEPDDHSPENLRSLCGPHHRARTARQAASAAAQRRARLVAPTKPHPGLR